jgi:hypothetical protein
MEYVKPKMTSEDWIYSVKELMKLVEEQDTVSVDFCDNILSTYQLAEEELFKLKRIKSNLEDFEFDAAFEILKNEC